MNDFPGLKIGKEIGRGAYGKVYELPDYPQPAVIKIIYCPKDEDRKMVERECNIMMRLQSHPNIVKLLDTKNSKKSLKMGIILEYCEGGNLKSLIKETNIIYSMRTVVEWGIQLFGALSHLFEVHQIVHRDIQPANILIKDTIDYTLKIGDFGLGKEIEQTCKPSRAAGTDRYRSPPQYNGSSEAQINKDVMDSHKNDVYSLGLVLWEIIERTVVFTQYENENGLGFDRDRLLYDILLKSLPRLKSPECQKEIHKIIDRCVQFDRHSRPLANEVLNDLKEKTNDFIASLELSPRNDTNQKYLLRPIGFDGTKQWRIVNLTGTGESGSQSEIDQFTERGKQESNNLEVQKTMLEKFSVLSSEEKGDFVKNAQRIVWNLQQVSRYFDEARKLDDEIEKETNDRDVNWLRDNKTIEEIFELFVLDHFYYVAIKRNRFSGLLWASPSDFLQGHFWSLYSSRNRDLVYDIERLEELKSTHYTTRLLFRCYFSPLTGEEWFYLGGDEFVRKDLKLYRRMEGDWLKGKEKKVWQCKSEGNSSQEDYLLHYSHDETIDIDRQVKALKERLELMKKLAKVYIDNLIPVEQLKDAGQYIESLTNTIKSPYPGYVFQLRNPPRPICKHEGKCSMDGFENVKNEPDFGYRCSGLPDELYIPICSHVSQNELEFLEAFLDVMNNLPENFYSHVKDSTSNYSFFFLAFENFLDFDFFVLLDHPNNYTKGEKIPGFTLDRKFHYVDVELVEEHFNEIDPTKRIYTFVLMHWSMNMNGGMRAMRSCMEDRWSYRRRDSWRQIFRDKWIDGLREEWRDRWKGEMSGRMDMGEWMNAMHRCMNMNEWMDVMDSWHEVCSMKMQILDYRVNPKTEWFEISDESTWPEEFRKTRNESKIKETKRLQISFKKELQKRFGEFRKELRKTQDETEIKTKDGKKTWCIY